MSPVRSYDILLDGALDLAPELSLLVFGHGSSAAVDLLVLVGAALALPLPLFRRPTPIVRAEEEGPNLLTQRRIETAEENGLYFFWGGARAKQIELYTLSLSPIKNN